MKLILAALLGLCLVGNVACTNLNATQQGALSGTAVGALGGAGLAAIAGGSGTVGALVGAGVGALAGGIVGHQKGGGSIF